MSLKKWFSSKTAKSRREDAVDVDDLITLQRYGEAEEQLGRFLKKRPYDLRARQKLAELYKKTGRLEEAATEYMEIADKYAKEGFHDKALALLAQVSKLASVADKVWPKIERLRRAKELEQLRPAIMEALLGRRSGSSQSTVASIKFDRLWSSLVRTRLVDRLDAAQLKQLFGAFRIESSEPKDEIARRGQKLEAMFFLVSGKVEVVVTLPGGSSPVLRVLEAGALFGEQALFEHKPWVATYRTAEKSMLLRLDRHGLETALHGNPDPRGLLDALREQQMDTVVAEAVGKTLDDLTHGLSLHQGPSRPGPTGQMCHRRDVRRGVGTFGERHDSNDECSSRCGAGCMSGGTRDPDSNRRSKRRGGSQSTARSGESGGGRGAGPGSR